MHVADTVVLNSKPDILHCFLGVDEWNSLQHLSGKDFTLFVGTDFPVCNALSSNLKCLSPTQFLELQSLEGHHVFIQPDLANISSTLRWYQKLKAQNPTKVSACIYTPRWYNRKWRNKLSMLQQLKVYTKGTCLLPKQPLKYDMELWFDPVHAQLSLQAISSSQLKMQFSGSIQGMPVHLLVDSGDHF